MSPNCSARSMVVSEHESELYNQKYRPNRLNTKTYPKFVVFNTGETTKSEFLRIISSCIDDQWANAVGKVQRVVNRKSPPRLVVEIRPDVAEAFKRQIRQTFDETNPSLRRLLGNHFRTNAYRKAMPGKWRVVPFIPFKERKGVTLEKMHEEKANRLVTWNINGFSSKRLLVQDLLYRRNVGVACLQETLHSTAFYPLRIEGFTTFGLNREEGFRGQAILVRKAFAAYQIPHEDHRILHVKISQWKTKEGGFPLHVFSVYSPSGGNRRRERTELLQKLFKITDEIIKADANQRLIIAGDFNESREELLRKLDSDLPMELIEMSGTNITRFPKVGRPRDLDHFITMTKDASCFSRAKVLTRYAASDHRPVVVKVRSSLELPKATAVRTVYDRRVLHNQRKEICTSNRWSCLEVEGMEVDQMVNTFNQDADRVLKHFEAKKSYIPQSGPPHFPDQLKGLLRNVKQKARESAAVDTPAGRDALAKAKARYDRVFKKWNARRQRKSYTRVGEDMLTGDYRSAWNRVRHSTALSSDNNKGMPLAVSQPLRDEHMQLQSEPQEVNRIMTEHYKALHQDDPWRFSHFPRYWTERIAHLNMTEEDDIPDGCPVITWPEVLEAVRKMNRDTSPGKDGLHINMCKAMVRVECMEQLKILRPGRTEWDGIQVDLPADQLPENPLTQLGKSTFAILRKVWTTREIPSAWEVNVVVSLFKGGNPEDPNNYRGITLISVLQKILTGVIMRRLYKFMDSVDYVFDEDQAGFRPHGEAIAQFVALAEIVRRRWNFSTTTLEAPTFALFIDLKKAYDKVPLELVLAVLRKFKFPPHLIELIRSIYLHTKLAVRTGDIESDPYELWRGLRQGCLLSPVLFIILVSNLLEFIFPGGGVGTPTEGRLQNSSGLCHGLLYADDMVSLQESIPQLEEFIRAFSDWCNCYWMEPSPTKCGIMCWTGDPDVRQAFRATQFKFPGFEGEIPKVDSYKYLGIEVDDTFPYSRTPMAGRKVNEETYVSSLVKKGMTTLHQLRPALIDPFCPLALKSLIIRTFLIPKMLYGSEWLGFRQLNSAPIQRVVNTACRWAFGYRGKSNSVDSMSLNVELGIPSIEEEMAAARARLYYKSQQGRSKTWLTRLVQTERNSTRSSSWVFGSRRNLKILLRHRNIDKDVEDRPLKETRTEEVTLRGWAARGQVAETHVKSNMYKSSWLRDVQLSLSDTLDEFDIYDMQLDESLAITGLRLAEFGFNPAEERFSQVLAVNTKQDAKTRWESERIRLVREVTRERSYKANKNTGWTDWYDKWGFGETRNFMKAAYRVPQLIEGVRILSTIRVRAFPSIRKTLLAKGYSEMQTLNYREVCPLCGHTVYMNWEWAHLLLECSARTVLNKRQELVDPLIRLVEEELYITGTPVFPNKPKISGGRDRIPGMVLAIYLVGGTVMDYHGCSFTLGFGHADSMPRGMSSFGWIGVASFFQEIFDLYDTARKDFTRVMALVEPNLRDIEDYSNSSDQTDSDEFNPDDPVDQTYNLTGRRVSVWTRLQRNREMGLRERLRGTV